MHGSIVEIPIRYRGRPNGAESKLSLIRDGLQIFWVLSTRLLRERLQRTQSNATPRNFRR
jgi:hypothetical protein